MTTLADRWGIHPSQSWLHGRQPEHPVSFDEEHGTWDVYGYAEAVEILGDHKRFSSDFSTVFPGMADESQSAGNILQMDPPDHRKLRTLVSHAFTPKMVADLEPRIAELTGELLDNVAGRDEFDLVTELAYPLPVIVIAELLGVPGSDRELFRKWADLLFTDPEPLSLNDEDGEQMRRFEKQQEELQPMLDYLHAHAAERRRHPREDLLSKLVQAEVDGEQLTDLQVVNFANILLLAGHITTTMLLGNTVLCLDGNPDQAERVRADRRLVPSAIEESLRLLSPFAQVARVTTIEVELGGRKIPPNQVLMVWLSAANHDVRQFDRPDVFDPARDPNPHLAFGRGVHFCLGAPLARLEGRIAMNVLLDRFPTLRTDPANPPSFMVAPSTLGVRHLPLRTQA
ncbi:cytochrome P450 [Amycolatopsis magusensis]|uniref:Cytochrome P450 n=1 Tax=Amycolatopsis magusensis TaxID=882444 RepID=A0ABS4Q2B6_9PSEU|nr:cytochrome P450 [Amycolatopsis magusensis]MBP2185815.1 cytochrome P450 [Amycolatopsis magusensis]